MVQQCSLRMHMSFLIDHDSCSVKSSDYKRTSITSVLEECFQIDSPEVYQTRAGFLYVLPFPPKIAPFHLISTPPPFLKAIRLYRYTTTCIPSVQMLS